MKLVFQADNPRDTHAHTMYSHMRNTTLRLSLGRASHLGGLAYIFRAKNCYQANTLCIPSEAPGERRLV